MWPFKKKKKYTGPERRKRPRNEGLEEAYEQSRKRVRDALDEAATGVYE